MGCYEAKRHWKYVCMHPVSPLIKKFIDHCGTHSKMLICQPGHRRKITPRVIPICPWCLAAIKRSDSSWGITQVCHTCPLILSLLNAGVYSSGMYHLLLHPKYLVSHTNFSPIYLQLPKFTRMAVLLKPLWDYCSDHITGWNCLNFPSFSFCYFCYWCF